MDCRSQLEMNFSVVELQTMSQSQTYTEVPVTAWWPADTLIQYSFLNSSKAITSEIYAQQFDEKHQHPQPASDAGQ